MTNSNKKLLLLIVAAFVVCTASYLGTSALGGTSLTLTAQPNASVFASGAQAIPDTTATAVTFDSESWDVGGLHSTSVNTDRITVPVGGDGLWQCDCNVIFAANAVGRRTVQIRKVDSLAATTVFATGKQLLGDATFTSSISANGKINAVAGDYFNITAQQVSTGSLNTAGGAANTFLSCAKLY